MTVPSRTTITLLTAPSVTCPVFDQDGLEDLGLFRLLTCKHIGQQIHALDVATAPADVLGRHRVHAGRLDRPGSSGWNSRTVITTVGVGSASRRGRGERRPS